MSWICEVDKIPWPDKFVTSVWLEGIEKLDSKPVCIVFQVDSPNHEGDTKRNFMGVELEIEEIKLLVSWITEVVFNTFK